MIIVLDCIFSLSALNFLQVRDGLRIDLELENFSSGYHTKDKIHFLSKI